MFGRSRPSRRHGNRLLAAACAYAVQHLEPRYLLATLNVTGTFANDTIAVATLFDGFIHVTINGDENVYSDLAYDSILVRGGEGNDSTNDSITIVRTGGNRVTVDGNLGNDTLRISTGDYEDAMQADVHFEDLQGDDTLIIDDSSGDGGEDYYLDPGYTGGFSPHAFANERGGESVYWSSSVDRVSILGSNGSDEMHVGTPRGFLFTSNVTYSAGAGNDTIRYGSDVGPGDGLELGSVIAMTVDGGAGNDKLVFDDRDPESLRFTYTVTPTHAMNQRSTNFELIEILSHPDFTPGEHTAAVVSGNAGAAEVYVNDAERVYAGAVVGNVVVPIDFDDAGINLRTADVFLVQVVDQNAAGAAAPWTYDWPRVHKGTSHINATNAGSVVLSGGTSDDVFNVVIAIPEVTLTLDGGDGNDVCQTSNGLFVMQDNDLDDMGFANVDFIGGDGIDLIDLNDSADEIGDGDDDYLLRFDATAQEYLLEKTGALVVARFPTGIERVNIVGDADSNDIRIRNRPVGAQYGVTVNGGAGADIILNDSPGNPSTLAGCSIIGGAGPDTLIIDGGGSGNTSYVIDDFLYTIGTAAPSAYDASVESIVLSAGQGNNHVRVTGKPLNSTLNVDGLAGDDTIEVGGGDIDDFGFAADNTTVTGGAGNDLIVFDDVFDGAGEDENYLIDGLFFEKGGARVTHLGFDRMEVRGGTANSFYRISSTFMPTTILGGAGNESVLFPPANLDVLNNRPLTIDLGAGSDLVVASDGADMGNDAYALYSDRLEKNPGATPLVIHYSRVETFNVIGGTGNNVIRVHATAAGADYTIDAAAGNDAVHLGGGGDVSADLLGAVSIQGNTGIDTLFADNAGDATPATQVLTSNSFTDGRTHGYGGIDSVVVNAGAGGGTLSINSNSVPVTFNGGAGNDNVHIGNGNIDANADANITINGNAGDDHVLFDDQADATGSDSYEFNAGDVLRKPLHGGQFRTFDANTVERRTLLATGGANSITVNTTASELTINANGGNDNIVVLDSAGFVTVDTGAELPSAQPTGDVLSVNPDFGTANDLPASVRLAGDDRLADLTVRTGGILQTGGLIDVTRDFVLDGVIDVTRGTMIVRNAAARVRDFGTWLADGYAGGTWDGTGTAGAIHSSRAATSPAMDAVGYATGSDLFTAFPATFEGQEVGATDVILRLTLYGDANLDGGVNLTDFNRLAGNFGQSARRWAHGDADFTGAVNLADFNRLAGNFGLGAATPATGSPSTQRSQPRLVDRLKDLLDRDSRAALDAVG